MKTKEEEIKEILDQGVRDGHMECDAEGRYRMTAAGTHALAVHKLLELFDHDHSAAYTFGALVFVTALKPEVIESGLVQLVTDGIVRFGVLNSKFERYIFHLCPQQGELRLFAGKGESAKGRDKYAVYVERVLQSVSKNTH